MSADLVSRLVSGGGTLALAVIVWMELHQLRISVEDLTGSIAVLVDREERR